MTQADRRQEADDGQNIKARAASVRRISLEQIWLIKINPTRREGAPVRIDDIVDGAISSPSSGSCDTLGCSTTRVLSHDPSSRPDDPRRVLDHACQFSALKNASHVRAIQAGVARWQRIAIINV